MQWLGSVKVQKKIIHSCESPWSLQKCYLTISNLHLEIGISTMDLGTALLSLAEAETNKTIISNVKLLSEVQQDIKELHEKQVR